MDANRSRGARGSTETVELSYRPLRRVVSLPAGDMRSFRSAVKYFTPRWGGALNFIAVEDDSGNWDETTRRCVAFADLDLFTVLGEDAQTRRQRLARTWDSVDPTRGADEYVEMAPWYPGITNQFAHQQLPSGEAFPSWLAAAWGEPVDPWPDGPPVGMGYIGALMADWSPGRESPLARGSGLLSANWTLPPSHGLVLVPIPEPEALTELAFFWNIRAALWPFGHWVGVLPLFDVDLQPGRFRLQFLQLLVNASAPERGRILLVDIGRSMTDARARLNWLLSEQEPGPESPGLYQAGPMDLFVEVGPPRLPGLPYRISTASAHQLPSRLPNAIAFSLTPPNTSEGWCAVDVRGADPRLELPQRETVGQLVHARAQITRDGVSVLIQPSQDHTVALNIPSDLQVIDAVLQGRGLTGKPSTGGRWADQLLFALGGALDDTPL